MIQVSNLSFSYTKQPFISNMIFSVSAGEIFGFLGPSGAGKSTLQKVLIGMLTTYQGSAMVNGVECRERTKCFYEDIDLFRITPAWIGYYSINVCMEMVSGHTSSAIGIFLVIAIMAILFVLSKNYVLKMWRGTGGMKL